MSLEDVLEAVQATDPGRQRPNNEDSTALTRALGLAVVADGMGGYRAGEVASAVAVTTVVKEVEREMGALVGGGRRDAQSGLTHESLMLRDAVVTANTLIYEASRNVKDQEGMGTTCVAALFHNDTVSVAHAGDARAYGLRGDRLERLTKDHSMLQRLVDEGPYTAAEAEASVGRNLVTRALGLGARVDVEVHEFAVEVGDLYLLCSDGLTSMVDDREIRDTLRGSTSSLDGAAQRLIQLANDYGGEDNISVVLVRVCKAFPRGQSGLASLLDWFD